MELVQQLKEDGKAKGLCRMWQMKLRTGLDYEQLIQLYIKGIDFCISENYPTLDFIREHFKGKCEVYGVFVDDEVTDKVNVPDVVLNGDCKAMLEYDGYSVSRVYARHDSHSAVNVSDNAIVTIDAFDNSYLYVAVAGTDAKVLVNLYGNAKADIEGVGIEVRQMNKNTY